MPILSLSAPLPLRCNLSELRPANLATLGPPTKTRGGIADQVWNDKYAVMIQKATSVYICNLPIEQSVILSIKSQTLGLQFWQTRPLIPTFQLLNDTSGEYNIRSHRHKMHVPRLDDKPFSAVGSIIEMLHCSCKICIDVMVHGINKTRGRSLPHQTLDRSLVSTFHALYPTVQHYRSTKFQCTQATECSVPWRKPRAPARHLIVSEDYLLYKGRQCSSQTLCTAMAMLWPGSRWLYYR